jgi:hypothetical protein
MIDGWMLAFDIRWTGIAGDEKRFVNQVPEEDLFTLMDREEAASGQEMEWDDFEEEDEYEVAEP